MGRTYHYVPNSSSWEADWDKNRKHRKYLFSGTLLKYYGIHATHKAASSDVNWEIWKYTFDSSDCLSEVEGPLKGAWDNSTGLAWSSTG